jgi:hypothetical protein
VTRTPRDDTQSDLTRRQLVVGAGAFGAALLAGCERMPFQQREPTRVPRLGVLWTAEPLMIDYFRHGLRELGYVENQNIVLENRFPEAR